MKSKLVVVLSALTIGVGAVVFGYFVTQSMKMDRSQFDRAKLKVVSYPAFISSYGPGPELAKQFKERTGIDVELVNGGDPSLIVERLKTDPNLNVDVLIGIDQLLAKKARELKWKDLPKDLFSRVREDLLVIEGAKFVPIDWSPLTVIYRDEKSSQPSVNHASISAFLSAAKGQSGVLEDPRSSVLGQQWLYWFDQQSVSSSELAATQPKLANSWTQAYGLFKRKSADWVFSYLTSVIFHWEKENDRSYKYMKFESGHPFQVDAAGVLERCKDCDAALKFVEFLLEPASQALIMQKNYMLPAIKSLQPSGLFSELPQLKLISYEAISDFQNKQQETQSRFLDSLE